MPLTVLCEHFPCICQLCGREPAVLRVIKPFELGQKLVFPSVLPVLHQGFQFPLLVLISNVHRWHIC